MRKKVKKNHVFEKQHCKRNQNCYELQPIITDPSSLKNSSPPRTKSASCPLIPMTASLSQIFSDSF
jgi:hypothetical protein